MTDDFFTLQPVLKFYIRKNDDKRLPFAVGEFRFTRMVYVFVIPLSDCDDRDFIKESDFKYFWKTLKHLDKYKNWSFIDYSNNNPRDFTINLNFEKGNKKN